MKLTKLSTLGAMLLTALALTGCMGGDEEDAAAPRAAETGTTENMGDMNASAVSVTSPAADLRITLDRLLGEHALLAMLATQKGFSGDKDFKAIAVALDENSV